MYFQKDSMETLSACAPVYGAENIVPYVDDLWEYLKDEVKILTIACIQCYIYVPYYLH